MKEITIQEKLMEDTKKNLDISLKQLMEIIKPINFENKYRKFKDDMKWIQENGITKMRNKLGEIINCVEYIRDHSTFIKIAKCEVDNG